MTLVKDVVVVGAIGAFQYLLPSMTTARCPYLVEALIC